MACTCTPLALSFRDAEKALSFFYTYLNKSSCFDLKLMDVKYNPLKLKNNDFYGYTFITTDETIVKAGSELIWLWIVFEPKYREILSISIKIVICLW
jgi:hypothetical protein